MISSLSYELSVLGKCVQHKNLSAAAAHVGLSQPQLSRVIGKIESTLNVVLLDRSARRKSGWTDVAVELATTFHRGMGRLEAEISALTEAREVTELRIGTLEGLTGMSLEFTELCFRKLQMKVVHLDVLDFQDLDSGFLGGNLDLIFTVRLPSKQKYQHLLEVGYQNSEKIESDPDTFVCSPFEFGGLEKARSDRTPHTLVSNSLSVRTHWLRKIGGIGVLPVDTRSGRGRGAFTIYLLGADLLGPRLWTKIESLYS